MVVFKEISAAAKALVIVRQFLCQETVSKDDTTFHLKNTSTLASTFSVHSNRGLPLDENCWVDRTVPNRTDQLQKVYSTQSSAWLVTTAFGLMFRKGVIRYIRSILSSTQMKTLTTVRRLCCVTVHSHTDVKRGVRRCIPRASDQYGEKG